MPRIANAANATQTARILFAISEVYSLSTDEIGALLGIESFAAARIMGRIKRSGLVNSTRDSGEIGRRNGRYSVTYWRLNAECPSWSADEVALIVANVASGTHGYDALMAAGAC